MKLADLRKLSVRQNLKIRFQLPNGLECVITEQGVARIPALSRAPDFNLEQELISITEFVLDPAVADRKSSEAPKRVRREELESLVAPKSASAGADHEDE
ncbi:MAG TPA: hypothetical protein VH640_09175 [Bryobacteraceae bacterium]|jgi:hypothetical protein